MTPSLSAFTLPSSIGLTNISSSRHHPPRLIPPREEGWTEVWGRRRHKRRDDGDGCDHDDDEPSPSYLPPRYVSVMKDECDYIGSYAGNDKSRMPRLTQYRVAWFEQIVLRMARIPHAVSNSGYAASESTGGLPHLLDLREDSEVESDESQLGSLSRVDGPVLIGHNQPGGMGSNLFHRLRRNGSSTSSGDPRHGLLLPSGSHIVDYLRLRHPRRMGESILFPEHMDGRTSGDAAAQQSLIQDRLDFILRSLRYGCSPAWEGVYRSQCMQASLHPNREHSVGRRRSKFFAWRQARSERALALCNLLPPVHSSSDYVRGGMALELFRYNDHGYSAQEDRAGVVERDNGDGKEGGGNVHQNHPFSSFFPYWGGTGGGDTGGVNVRRAMEFADTYYGSLEEKLVSSSVEPDGSGSLQRATFFLGTEIPTFVDALLFAHLAEALCDVHLILVLARHSCLVKYFQKMYDRYFGEVYLKNWADDGMKPVGWIHKNNVTNMLNAFNQTPKAVLCNGVSSQGKGDRQGMVHAIELMRKMAVHCNELDEALQDAVILRIAGSSGERAVLEAYQHPPVSRLYSWLMGGDVSLWRSPPPADEPSVKEADGGDDGTSCTGDEWGKEKSGEEADWKRSMREQAQRMKRDRRVQDELWMSGVVAVIALALFVSAPDRTKK